MKNQGKKAASDGGLPTKAILEESHRMIHKKAQIRRTFVRLLERMNSIEGRMIELEGATLRYDEAGASLRTCPFCGGRGEAFPGARRLSEIRCVKCGARGAPASSLEEISRKWNERKGR